MKGVALDQLMGQALLKSLQDVEIFHDARVGDQPRIESSIENQTACPAKFERYVTARNGDSFFSAG
jgi:hypothetical protein